MDRLLLLCFLVCTLCPLLVLCQDPPPCTLNDYEHSYTQCFLWKNNTRDLVYYLKPWVNCSGGVHPNNVYGLPCSVSCGAGHFLGLGNTNCSLCANGTFSIGGGFREDTWFEWPSYFLLDNYWLWNNNATSAHYTSAQQLWTLEGTNIRSGNITHYQSSVLTIAVYIVSSTGHVSFTYRVNAESGWDGLKFDIDGTQVLGLTSVTPNFVTFTNALTTGYHVLRWQYFKDGTVTKNEDAAFISMIEVGGLDFSDEQCELCAEGTYAPSTGSTQCLPCAANYFSNTTGASACTPCPSTHYSFSESASCIPRLPCTSSDYEQVYTPCDSTGTRTLQSFWLNPFICDNSTFSLPPLETGKPCGLCSDGEVRNPTTHQCEFCPAGQYSTGGAPCQVCPLGSVAVKVFEIDEFDDWPIGSSTNCTGDCAEPGWVLHSSYMDSGPGHGNFVNSWFQFTTSLASPGTISFSTKFYCPSAMCSLTFTDSFGDSEEIRTNVTVKRSLPAGNSTLKWNFSKFGFTNSRSDRAELWNILVTGVAIGGALNCTQCANGTIRSTGEDSCHPCPAGRQNDPTFSTCIPCPAGYHNPVAGTTCTPCGAGTTSTPDFTGCLVNCTFSPDGVTLYDLTPLKSAQAYGPIMARGASTTSRPQEYFINVCSMADTCSRNTTTPILTYACQTTTVKVGTDLYEGKDLGQVLAWSPLPSVANGTTPRLGVMMNFTHGDLCPVVSANFERQSHIQFICNTSIGIGAPEAGGDKGEIENKTCVYDFIWKTKYACPICSAVNTRSFYMPCQNGSRTKTYFWQPFAQCYGGTLPPPETVPCAETTTSCPSGQYLSPNGNCITCQAGSFSVGGGEEILTWAPAGGALPERFTSNCVSGSTCTLWEGGEDGTESVSAGTGNSTLVAPFEFVVAGGISFSYKVYSTNTHEHFSFTINGVEQLQLKAGVSRLGWVSYSSPLPKGNYLFVWTFINGYPGTYAIPRAGAAIKSLKLQGTDFHDDSCTPCPPGFHSPANSSTCNGCAANYFSNTPGNPTCTPCPVGQHSLARATDCTLNPPCTTSDYTFEFSDCYENRTRLQTAVYLQPQVCNEVTALPSPVLVECAFCLPGYEINSVGRCLPCPSGEYVDADTRTCVAIPAGGMVVRKRTYFYDGPTEFPAGFTTSCSGDCGHSGWRLLYNGVDSGYHGYNGVDSVLKLSTTVTNYASISFDFQVEINSVLDFYMDNVFVTSLTQPTGTYSMAVPAGEQVFMWNYHQHNGTTGRVTLTNVAVTGSEDPDASTEFGECPAGSTSDNGAPCTPCEPGNYAPYAGATSCYPCGEMTYTTEYGQTECRDCGEGTYSNHSGATYCSTRSCKYIFIGSDGSDPVEFSLASTDIIGPITVGTSKYFFNFCNSSVGTAPCASGSPTHACATEADAKRDWGTDFRWIAREEQIQADSPNITFQILIGHGDAAGCPAGVRRSMLFNFECDSKGINTPTYVSQLSSTCYAVFNWPSLMGCEVCDSAVDYDLVAGQCVDGMRTQQRIRNKVCNGPQVYPEASQSCSGTVEFPIAVIFVIVGVFLVLVVVAVIVFVKNRRISEQYSRLKEQTSTNLDTRHTDENL